MCVEFKVFAPKQASLIQFFHEPFEVPLYNKDKKNTHCKRLLWSFSDFTALETAPDIRSSQYITAVGSPVLLYITSIWHVQLNYSFEYSNRNILKLLIAVLKKKPWNSWRFMFQYK